MQVCLTRLHRPKWRFGAVAASWSSRAQAECARPRGHHEEPVFGRMRPLASIPLCGRVPFTTQQWRWLVESSQLAEASSLIDIPALARRLGVGERFVRRLVAERGIEVIKVGRHVRFDPEVVEAWIEERRRAPERWIEAYYWRVERERRRNGNRLAAPAEPVQRTARTSGDRRSPR